MSSKNNYPTALYLKGWDDLGAMVVVNNHDEESKARNDGYRSLHDPYNESWEAKPSIPEAPKVERHNHKKKGRR